MRLDEQQLQFIYKMMGSTGGTPPSPPEAVDSQYGQRAVATNSIAWWPLDDDVAATEARSVIIGIPDGVLAGDPTFGANGFNPDTAVDLDGTGDKFDIYSSALATAFDGQNGSMSVYLNHDDWSSGSESLAVTLGNATNWIKVGKSDDDAVLVRYNTDGGGITRKTTYFQAGWIHLVLTWSLTADRLILYLDGAEQYAVNGVKAFTGGLASGYCYIGDEAAADTSPWDGKLQHVLIWDRVLTAGEVATLYGTGVD